MLQYLQLIKKNMWIANVVFIMAAAYLTAGICTLHIKSRMGATGPGPILDRIDSIQSKKVPITEFNAILSNNIFNSESALRTQFEETQAPSNEISPTNLDLLATMAGRPETSMALISHKNEPGKIEGYRWGEMVGEYQITSIEPRLVRLTKDGTEEVLRMPEQAKPTQVAKSYTGSETLAEGIVKVGEDEYIIDKSLIEDSFENIGKLMRQAKIIPRLKGGKIDGFKILKIKKKSLFSHIGLSNGDIIHQINNKGITGPEDALKLFEIFKTAKSISIDLERGKSKKTLSYTVR